MKESNTTNISFESIGSSSNISSSNNSKSSNQYKNAALSSKSVQKYLHDIDSIIAKRKQELNDIRQRSNNGASNNTLNLDEDSSAVAKKYVEKDSTVKKSLDIGSLTAETKNDIANSNNGNHRMRREKSPELTTPYKLEYSMSQPRSLDSKKGEPILDSPMDFDYGDVFPELLVSVERNAQVKGEVIAVSKGTELNLGSWGCLSSNSSVFGEVNGYDTSTSLDSSFIIAALDGPNISCSLVDDHGHSQLPIQRLLRKEQQKHMRVSPEEHFRKSKESESKSREEKSKSKLKIAEPNTEGEDNSEIHSFGDFEEASDELFGNEDEDEDATKQLQALTDGSLSSTNLQYHAIYEERSVSETRRKNGDSSGISNGNSHSRNNSLSGISVTSSVANNLQGLNVGKDRERDRDSGFPHQVNPQWQLRRMRPGQQGTVDVERERERDREARKRKEEQEQLQATKLKNELLEKKILEIEKLIDSDFSEHSHRTKLLHSEREKLWGQKLALEEELEEVREELLLVRSQLQNKSIRVSELELKLQNVEQAAESQRQETLNFRQQLAQSEREALAARQRADGLAAELEQVQDSILELSMQLQRQQLHLSAVKEKSHQNGDMVRTDGECGDDGVRSSDDGQAMQRAESMKDELNRSPSSRTGSDGEREGVTIEIDSDIAETDEARLQASQQQKQSGTGGIEELLNEALAENELLAKCLQEILWERNELVDRLTQAREVVKESNASAEDAKAQMLEAQNELRSLSALLREKEIPFVHETEKEQSQSTTIIPQQALRNVLPVPRIKQNYSCTLLLVAMVLIGVWCSLLAGLLLFFETSSVSPVHGRYCAASTADYSPLLCSKAIPNGNFVTS